LIAEDVLDNSTCTWHLWYYDNPKDKQRVKELLVKGGIFSMNTG